MIGSLSAAREAAGGEATAAVPPGSALSAQTIATLEYFPRWETPVDSEAHQVMIRLTHDCPDFAAFRKSAPPGSETRRLVFRFFGSFEEAARLMREHRLNEALFFDSWYDVAGTWEKVRPWIAGLRAESGDPRLFAGFEWLAGHGRAFWAEWNRHPPARHPLLTPAPTPDEMAVFAAFDRASPRTAAEWQLIEELRRNGPTFEDFRRLIPPGSPRYSTFDWLLCYYDRAGVLVQNGILHPRPLFDSWRSPAELWAICELWVQGLRRERHDAVYSDFEWLAGFERQWRAGQRPAASGAPR